MVIRWYHQLPFFKTLFLLAVAILVLLILWLPYTCILLFVQCLQQCGIEKLARFTARMQPFLDAHCGPFKAKHRYWFGTLLVARAIPLLIGASAPTDSDKITLLSTVIVVGVLLVMQSRVYRKLYVFLSESLFLLNLLFYTASALFASSVGSEEDQKWFTTVSVTVTFVHFVVIVLFSTVRHIHHICCRRYQELANGNTPDFNSLSYQRDRSDM